MPIPGNVIPWFQMNGKVGQPSNNSAIQAPYRFFRIICLQECKCHCINIMDISIWTSNNIISFHVLFSLNFFYNRLSKPEMYFSCRMINCFICEKMSIDLNSGYLFNSFEKYLNWKKNWAPLMIFEICK